MAKKKNKSDNTSLLFLSEGGVEGSMTLQNLPCANVASLGLSTFICFIALHRPVLEVYKQ